MPTNRVAPQNGRIIRHVGDVSDTPRTLIQIARPPPYRLTPYCSQAMPTIRASDAAIPARMARVSREYAPCFHRARRLSRGERIISRTAGELDGLVETRACGAQRTGKLAIDR